VANSATPPITRRLSYELEGALGTAGGCAPAGKGACEPPPYGESRRVSPGPAVASCLDDRRGEDLRKSGHILGSESDIPGAGVLLQLFDLLRTRDRDEGRRLRQQPDEALPDLASNRSACLYRHSIGLSLQ
jgi:hypothetical protein